MNKFITMVFVIISAFIGMHNTLQTTTNVSKAGNLIKPFCDDDEPIIMHSHVHTSGGNGIAGATITLTPSGTSTPLYTGTTNTDGDYTFSSVIQGNYQYKITHTGYQDKTVT